ncbi:MAG: DinB family protein [Candidatus Latescibacterota bacterium]|nr:MAG: DinB family protein [Candidatus Latescibacterota bacterium]
MSWHGLLKREVEYVYKVTNGLVDLVDDDKLEWKPETGNNWMTTGQLLKHISDACGMAFKGFVAGDWGMPDGVDLSEMKPEDMLPPAEKMPTLGSVAEAKKLVADDKATALEMLERCTDEELATETAPAPWDQSKMILGHRLLQMVDHLKLHNAQLFYYLKLQGKPVNTNNLWGM